VALFVVVEVLVGVGVNLVVLHEEVEASAVAEARLHASEVWGTARPESISQEV
jgi:predicted cobalt transporter CbtA